MYKIGIDLSTTNTGIVILDENNNLFFKRDLTFRTFSELNYKYNFNLIYSIVVEISTIINNKEFVVGIELNNRSLDDLSIKFAIYSGAFISEFIKYDNCKWIKTFDSNKWYKLIGVKIGIDCRVICKSKSRDFVKINCIDYDEKWSDDICDAYCIANKLLEVQSSEEYKKMLKSKNKRGKKWK